MSPLNIFAVARDAYLFVWEVRRPLLAISLPFVGVFSLASLLVYLPSSGTEDASHWEEAQSKIVWLYFLLLIPETIVAVACHRVFLIRGETIVFRNACRWRRRHTRYFFIWLCISISAVVVLIVPIISVAFWPLITDTSSDEATWNFVTFAVGAIALALVMACIYGLFGMLLPATAIDRRMSLRASLTLWKVYGWRLTLIVLLVTLPLTAIGILHGEIDGLISKTQQTHAQMSLFVVSVFITFLESFIVTSLIAAALSIVYAEVNGHSADK